MLSSKLQNKVNYPSLTRVFASLVERIKRSFTSRLIKRSYLATVILWEALLMLDLPIDCDATHDGVLRSRAPLLVSAFLFHSTRSSRPFDMAAF